MLSERPVYAEVDCAAIRHNMRELKNLLKPTTRLCAVVKADGYGHGALAVAAQAIAVGADYLAVALLDEAVELRAAGIGQPLLVLGYTPPSLAHAVVFHNLTQTIYTLDQASALSAAAGAMGRTATVHIKIDTGMGRLGIFPEEAAGFFAAVAALPHLHIEGAYTHFAMADAVDKSHAHAQLAAFRAARKRVQTAGVAVPIWHCANSAATIDLPDAHLDMVRTGIAMYGLWPSDDVDKSRVDLRAGLRFKARIAHLKDVPTGTSVSYGCTFTTARPSRIATLPVGYADGWTRMLSGRATVVVRGRRVPVVGRICMDQCMIDVTDVPEAQPDDEVLLFGGPELPADEVAATLGTINYEITCMVGKRVPRRYV
ncbi:MAG: alanine racemase [Planctomycetaceae bacterium]|nr:alanine racemase [Planctomycetaceae bacterium]